MTDEYGIHVKDQLSAASKDALDQAQELTKRFSHLAVDAKTVDVKDETNLNKVVDHWLYLTFDDDSGVEQSPCPHLRPNITVLYGYVGLAGYIGCQECAISLTRVITQASKSEHSGLLPCDACGRLCKTGKTDEPEVFAALVNTGNVNVFCNLCKDCANE